MMNSLVNMLDNIHMVYPGEDCDTNTFAYVFPTGGQGDDTEEGKKLQVNLAR